MDTLNRRPITLLFALSFAVQCLGFFDEIDPIEKYNLERLQWDNRPVWWIIGKWVNENPGWGRQLDEDGYPYGDILDFGIGITTVFGARPLNYTGKVVDGSGNVQYYEYGYLPVKNTSSIFGGKDLAWPNARLAFLTVTDRGNTMLEEGLAVGNSLIKMSSKAVLRRTFDEPRATDGRVQDVQSLDREFFIKGDRLFQHIVSLINGKPADFVVVYKKVLGWSCQDGCQFMERSQDIEGACQLCS